MAIDKTKGEPLYDQLVEELKMMIEYRQFLPGDLLPSESEFCNRYDISRGSVRKALQILTNEGIIETFPGKGSIVAKPKLEYSADKIFGYFSHIAHRAGKTASGKTVELKRVETAPAYVYSHLNLEENTPLVYVKRLRFVDGEPWTIETIWFIEEVGNTVFDADIETGSLYEHLNREGVVFLRSKNRITAVNLYGEEAELLDCPAGSAGLAIQRTMYLQDDRPFEFSEDLSRGDRMRLSIDVNYLADETDLKLKVKNDAATQRRNDTTGVSLNR